MAIAWKLVWVDEGTMVTQENSTSVAIDSASHTLTGLTPRWRRVLSALISLHLLAVFLAPFTFASSPQPGAAPPSPLARLFIGLFQPYIDALFLDHGYAFFAPDPGPSHLFRARLEFDDDREPQELLFPDRSRQWPRLLYHRHFMLSERLNDGYRPPVAPPAVAQDAAQLAVYRQGRWDYETYFERVSNSYREHLRQRYGARRVTIVRLEHRLLYPDELREQGRRPDAPELFDENPEDQRRESRP